MVDKFVSSDLFKFSFISAHILPFFSTDFAKRAVSNSFWIWLIFPLDSRAWKVDGLMPKTANALANSKFSRRICVLISSSSLGFSSVYAQARYFWPKNLKNHIFPAQIDKGLHCLSVRFQITKFHRKDSDRTLDETNKQTYVQSNDRKNSFLSSNLSSTFNKEHMVEIKIEMIKWFVLAFATTIFPRIVSAETILFLIGPYVLLWPLVTVST